MKLSDQWRFFITPPGESQVEVFPINQSIKWVDEYNDEFGFFRKILDTDLIFKNYNGHNTFNVLYELEMDRDLCTDVPILVQVSHDHSTWTNYWNGKIKFKKGRWDLDNHKVEIKPVPDDSYECIFDIAQKRVNLLEIQGRETLQFFVGQIQEADPDGYFENAPATPISFPLSSFPDPVNSPYRSSEGWTIWRIEYYGVTKTETTPIDLYQAQLGMRVFYIREFVSGGPEPDGEGWIQVDGTDWARRVDVRYDHANSTDVQAYVGLENVDLGTVIRVWKVPGLNTDQLEADTFDNGLSLESVLNKFTDECSITWMSDFFNIQPDGTNPTNTAYDFADEYLADLICFQASDIIRASALNNATRFEMTFAEFWQNLKTMCIDNIRMFWDSGNAKMRVEHITYFTEQRMLNLLDADLRKYILGKAQYEYDDADFPRKETWEFKYGTLHRDFDDAYVEYPSNCTNENPEDNVKEYKAKQLVTNLSYLYNNESLVDDDEKIKNVMVIISTQNNVVTKKVGSLTQSPSLNGALAFVNLTENLGIWERPLKSGIMNEQKFEFVSRKRLRKQTPLAISMHTSDYVQSYEPDHMVRSQLGWGEVDKSTYEVPYERLTLELLF